MPALPDTAALMVGWARSGVAPVGGALAGLQAHELAAPVVQALLRRAGLPLEAVDAVVVGNALGAGGNPARMVSLAAGLPDRCAALSVDSQCCSGLDAVSLAVGLLASGQASVVVAGGVEAWSRAPIRQVRPLRPGDAAVPYERPPFAPDAARDPDLLDAAADYAALHGITRAQQDAYAVHSHQRALASQAHVDAEIVPVGALAVDSYVRSISAERAARMPVAVARPGVPDCSLSPLAISAKADGAAFVLLATPAACGRLGLAAQAVWCASVSVGADPAAPLLAAHVAAQAVLARCGMPSAQALQAVELHDAFAVQGLQFCAALGLEPGAVNRHGGGLARGHPIGASGAVALVRVLADLAQGGQAGSRGLAAVAGAGGIGAAAVVEKL